MGERGKRRRGKVGEEEWAIRGGREGKGEGRKEKGEGWARKGGR